MPINPMMLNPNGMVNPTDIQGPYGDQNPNQSQGINFGILNGPSSPKQGVVGQLQPNNGLGGLGGLLQGIGGLAGSIRGLMKPNSNMAANNGQPSPVNPSMLNPSFPGMLSPGNIDLNNRPKVQNADGSYSTVRTITADIDGKTVLLPTVVDGKILSNKDAIDYYRKTGQNLGVFKDQQSADQYDERMHSAQGWNGPTNKWNNSPLLGALKPGGSTLSQQIQSNPAANPAVDIIKKFEGFSPTSYWDVNAHRIGYGSDTITKPDGSIVKVTPGMKVTPEDAERDLARRITEFQNHAASQVGVDKWKALPQGAQAALTSVTYNYGSLPKSVIKAVDTGSPAIIAGAVRALGSDNKGVNRNRRNQEANMIANSVMAANNQPIEKYNHPGEINPPQIPPEKLDDILRQLDHGSDYAAIGNSNNIA